MLKKKKTDTGSQYVARPGLELPRLKQSSCPNSPEQVGLQVQAPMPSSKF